MQFLRERLLSIIQTDRKGDVTVASEQYKAAVKQVQEAKVFYATNLPKNGSGSVPRVVVNAVGNQREAAIGVEIAKFRLFDIDHLIEEDLTK